MSDLKGVDGEDGDGCVHTEALKAGQKSVGADEEGDDVSEGGHTDRHPGVTHGPPEEIRQTGALAGGGLCDC